MGVWNRIDLVAPDLVDLGDSIMIDLYGSAGLDLGDSTLFPRDRDDSTLSILGELAFNDLADSTLLLLDAE